MIIFYLLLSFCSIWIRSVVDATTNDGHEIFCEGDRANFTCPSGQYIALRIANYGRFSLGICNKDGIVDWSTTCQNDRTLEILQKLCNGRNSCNFAVNDDMFGDPCPKTKKYLELKYDCTDLPASSTIPLTTSTTTVATTRKKEILRSTTTITGFRVFSPSKTKLCDFIEKRGIKWPRTPAGEIAKVQCPPNFIGEAEWFCDLNGTWSSDGYDLSNCVSDWSAMLKQDLLRGDGEVNLIDILTDVRKLTKNEDLYGGDLVVLSSVINGSVSRLVRSEGGIQTLELVVESVNNMAKKHQEAAWMDLKTEKRKRVANSLMGSVDDVGAILASSLLTEKIEHCSTSSIVAEISNVKVHDYVKFPSISLYDASYDSVDIPREALTTKNANSRVVYVTYKTMGQHVTPRPLISNDGTLVERVVASNITSVSVVDEYGRIGITSRLSRPVVITFVIKDQTNLSSPTCVWWNKHLLEWSEKGCSLGKTNSTHIVCHCSHMTHFAVLMNLKGDVFSQKDEMLLTMLTYAGCTLSIVCLFLSIVAFHCFGRGGGDRIFIHKNLCLSLLVAESVFLFGIWQTENKVHCRIIAVSLHYSFLAALIWMLLEGIELYRMLVEVFAVSSKKPYLFIIGYGVPAVVVGISMWVDISNYGTKDYCWLKPESHSFLLGFTVPVSAIVFLNFAFLIMTLRIVGKCRQKSAFRYKCSDSRTTIADISKWVKGATALIFLLGLTWTFGFFWVDGQNVLLAYLFTIFNALQGFFIFLYHVVYNDRIQEDLRDWTQRSSWVPSCLSGSSRRSHPAPYMPGNRVPYNPSSNSSTGSELLYPSLKIEKYPQRIMASIDPRYNTAVHMACPRHEFPINGVYDYATIPYEALSSQPFLPNSYFNQLRQYPVRSSLIYNAEPSHFRPPPNFPPPPPPPPPAPSAGGNIISPRPHSSTLTKVSDDSAYSDGSSTFQYPNDSNSSAGMLLRMDLTRNPPVFVQGL